MGTKILIADDHKDVRDGLSDLLESRGYSTECFSNHRDLIDRYRSSWDDVGIVMTDIEMPDEGDGIKLIEYLRESGYNRPIIGMSADPGYRKSVISAGGDLTYFWHKNSGLTSLMDTINRALSEIEECDF